MLGNDSPAPSAQGTLAKTPLVHLFVYMADRTLTGSIVFHSPSASGVVESTIYFRDGAPAKVRTGEPVAHLGRVLFEIGLLQEDALSKSLTVVAESKELHGEYLVRMGLIDRAALIAGLRAQAIRKIAHLFQMSAETAFAFFENRNTLDRWGGPEVFRLDPLSLIWSGVCARADDPVIDATLARLGDAPLRVHDSADIARFRFTYVETSLVDLVRARPSTLQELIASQIAPDRTVRLLVYTLLITRHFDHGTSAATPVATARRTQSGSMRPFLEGRTVITPTGIPRIPSPIPSSHPAAAISSIPPLGDVSRVGGPTSQAPPASGTGRVPSTPAASWGPPRSSTPSPGPTLHPALRDTASQPPGRMPSTPEMPAIGHEEPRSLTPTGIPAVAGPPIPVARMRLKSMPVGDANSFRSSFPPPNLRPELAERRREILKRSALIDREDFFIMLGIAPDASPQTLQAAYFSLAKIWHTDRLPPEIEDVRDAAARVFARMSQAFETLSDPAMRQRYMEVLRRGEGTPAEAERVQQILDAAQDFQRAEVCYKKRDLAAAMEFAARAYEADPEQTDYVALYVTLEAAGRTGIDAKLDDLIKLLDQAIVNDDNCERAYFCRGMLRKRVGRMDAAIVDFRAACALNPKNLDAAREIRLYEMRKPKRTSNRPPSSPVKKPTSGAGFLNKLFKR